MNGKPVWNDLVDFRDRAARGRFLKSQFWHCSDGSIPRPFRDREHIVLAFLRRRPRR
jgi:hypothetical protein